MNYYERFLQSVDKWPHQVAVEVQHQAPDAPVESFTFDELRGMSDRVARWLCGSQVEQGSRCIILAANGPSWVAVFMGTLAAGCIAVPLDTAFNADQIRKLALDSGSTHAFVDARHVEVAQKAADGLNLRLVVIDAPADESCDSIAGLLEREASAPSDTSETFETSETFSIPVQLQPDEVAAILYSSGTTGDPKGVMLTHDNFYAETDSIFAAFKVGPEDSFLTVLPLFHALALAIDLLLPLAAGSRILFLESLNTTDLLRALPRVNIFICVPQFFYLIHERIWKEVGAHGKNAIRAFRAMLKLSLFGRRFGLNLGKVFFGKIHKLLGENMRFLGSGGSKLDSAIGREFEALGFTMLQGYGLTETTGCSMYTPPGEVDIASIGRPLPGNEVTILNPEQREGDVRPTGEIAIRGRLVMKGYWKRADATAAVLDHDGWLHTGDLGYMDTKGHVHITGRAKDVIVTSSGKNIYPEEIETHYLQTPYIKEISVLGLESAPGEPYAERLHGVVVPNFDVMKQRKIVNMGEVLRYEIENLSTKLAATKRILSYEIWQDDLPRTTTRKIKRFEVERRVRARMASAQSAGTGDLAAQRTLSDSDREWLDQPEVQRALPVIRAASKTKKDDIHPADNLELDLGLDSMERVELLVSLERELGGHVDDSVVSEIYTVRELVDAIRSSAADTGPSQQRPAWDSLLQVEPEEPEVVNVAAPHGFAERFWFLGSRLWNLIAHDLFHLQVEGVENLPKEGPFILSPNHQSYLDAPVVMGAVPWGVFRRAFFVGTSDIFGQGLRRRIGLSMKVIPVDPDANLVPAMRAGAYGLRHGKVLVLFPEGERSINGVPKVFKKGAAILSTHLNVPIVPVALDGFYEAWPRNRKFNRRAKLRVRFGKPIYPTHEPGSPEAAYDAITSELKNRVMEMWDELHAELYPQDAVEQGRVPTS